MKDNKCELKSKIDLGLKIGAAVGAVAAAGAFVIAPGHASRRQKAPFMGRYFAHRGLHSEDKKVPENSLEAFRLAAEAGYGMELDVQLSKDGQVVVFHDDTLDRVCGIHGKVCDYDYSELKNFRLCGSDYGIPLFTEVLDVIDGKGPLIVELKNGKRNKELCKKTYKILGGYSGQVCIESFNPLIVFWFRLHGRDLVRGQLATTVDDYPKSFPKPLRFIMSHTLMNFLARPQFIAYNIDGKRPLSVRLSELMGAMRVGWTSHDPKDKKRRDAVIFEFYKPELKFK